MAPSISSLLYHFKELRARLSKSTLCVGIDFGTSNSALAYKVNSNTATVSILPIDEDDRKALPSVVFLKKPTHLEDQEVFVPSIGDEVKYGPDWTKNGRTFRNFKLRLGKREFNGEESGKKEEFASITPEELAACILASLRKKLQFKYPYYDDRVTVTVPANWSPDQRRATEFAAKIAHLNDVELIEEPVAALNYLKSQKEYALEKEVERIMMIDFGGGTCDIAILNALGNTVKLVGVLGDDNLGGEKVDALLLNDFLSKKETVKLSMLPNDAKANLYAQMEEFKKTLNDRMKNKNLKKHSEHIYGLYEEESDIEYEITFDEFRELLKKHPFPELEGNSIIAAFTTLIEEAAETFSSKEKFDRVFVVGGSSHLYFVKEIVENQFEHLKWGRTIIRPDHPERCVVLGAALHQYQRLIRKRAFDPVVFYKTSLILPDTEPIEILPAKKTLPAQGRISISVDRPVKSLTVSFKHRNKTIEKNINAVNGNILPEHQIELTVRIKPGGIVSVDAKITYSQSKRNIPNLVVEELYNLDSQEAFEKSRIKYPKLLLEGDGHGQIK